MRPKIMTCRNAARSITYNELKVVHKQAQCIVAENFLKDLHHLTIDDKHDRFLRLSQLNERVRTSLHITLNFDPTDELSNEQVQKISRSYMKEIGFERQPYLVYRHYDAGHPHCHIVTSHIQADGDPMDLYNLGRNQSEKARLRLEEEYNLVTAEQKLRLRQQQKLEINGVQKITYGLRSTARAVSEVLEHVTQKYKYTDLEELNTVLRLYNVEAYRGREDSQLYQHRGLLYRILDENGNYIGVPLKASFFDCKPTLDNLEEKMKLNQTLKLEHKQRLELNVRIALLDRPVLLLRPCETLKECTQKLQRDHIRMVLRQDKEGNCHQAVYIDLTNKCVYNSKDLDEHCSLKAVQKLIERDRAYRQQQTLTLTQTQDLKQNLRHQQRHRLRHSLY